MASPGGFQPSHAPAITETGMKGFLKWLQREQPEVYKQVAPQVTQNFPRVFSDYNQSATQAMRAQAGAASLARRMRMRGGFSGLGQDSGTTDDVGYAMNPDLTINAATLTTDAPSFDTAVSTLQTPAIDTADAANTSAGTSTATTTGIASIINGITGLYTTQQQAQTANAITQLQLQRAQQGLSPLNIGMNANGIPTITGISAGSGSLMLIGVAVVAGLLMFMGGSKKAAA